MSGLTVDLAEGVSEVSYNNGVLEVEEELTEETVSVEDLAESYLSSRKPRFVVYTFKKQMDELRVAYPLVLIRFVPETAIPRLRMTYAQIANSVSTQLPTQYTVECRDVEDMTTEWMRSHVVASVKY